MKNINRISRKNVIIGILCIITLIIFISVAYVVDQLTDEDRDYLLNDEMLKLVNELNVYKAQHGIYPKSILEIRQTENLCVTMGYTKCKKVLYRPIKNYSDFHLAMHSFTWVELWYRKDVCRGPNDPHLTNEESDAIVQQYGTIYYFCAAKPESYPLSNSTTFPVYRKEPKIFDNPDEWPVL